MNWLKYRYLYFTISLLVIIPGVFSLLRFGFNPSIDFTGGSQITLEASNPDQQKITDLISPQLEIDSLNLSNNQITIRSNTIDQSQLDSIIESLKTDYPDIQQVSFNSVGPSAGRQLVRQTLVAAALAVSTILIFIAYTFKNIKYGLAATAATLHDTLILLGTFSIFGHFFHLQIDLLFVTAVLTTLSFSVHDTIVVFDHIRYLRTHHPHASFTYLANQAVTDTFIRSMSNSMTIIFMLLSLFVLGGETLHTFALALLVGAITGTYSSTFTAVPLLSLWQENRG